MMVKEFREQTRQLECHLDNMNKTSCCCGVSTSQCFLIVEIGRKPGISVKELSNILHIDKSSVSRAVEDLVQNGLVERMPSKEDRRYVVLNLSPKGQKRFEKIENDMYLKFEKILNNIPKEMHEQVINVLKLYNNACLMVQENSYD